MILTTYTHGVDSVLLPHNTKENQLAEDIVLLYFSDYRIEGGGGAIVKHP
jgi:hypothetical protein